MHVENAFDLLSDLGKLLDFHLSMLLFHDDLLGLFLLLLQLLFQLDGIQSALSNSCLHVVIV